MPSPSEPNQLPPASPFQAPACVKCGEPMTLVRIEPHDRFTNLDAHTYECACGWRMAAAVARL
jgi:hypothetical protein